MRIDVEDLYHFALGIHSNIPPCCVMYYCTVWSKYSHREMEMFSHQLKEPRREVQYVRCPDCFRKDIWVEIHICEPRDECFRNALHRALFPPSASEMGSEKPKMKKAKKS